MTLIPEPLDERSAAFKKPVLSVCWVGRRWGSTRTALQRVIVLAPGLGSSTPGSIYTALCSLRICWQTFVSFTLAPFLAMEHVNCKLPKLVDYSSKPACLHVALFMFYTWRRCLCSATEYRSLLSVSLWAEYVSLPAPFPCLIVVTEL